MMSGLRLNPFEQFFDVTGDPLDGGKLYIGLPNTDPKTNQIAIFWDEALTIAAPQPLQTTGGFLAYAGSPAVIYAAEAAYSVEVLDINLNRVFYAQRVSRDKNSEYTTLKDFDGLPAAAMAAAAVSNSILINVREPIDVTLTSAQALAVLTNLHKFSFDVPSILRLPAQTIDFNSVQIATYTQSHANLSIFGALPVDVTINSVLTATGGNGAWSVTYALADATSVSVGDYLKIDKVQGGAAWVDRATVRPVAFGELAVGTHKMGTGTVSGTTISFSYESELGLPENWISVGDLIHFKGQTRAVTAVDNVTRTVSVASAFNANTELDEFDSDLLSYQWWYYTKPNAGTIEITNSINVYGTGTDFMSYVEVGDILLFNGVMSEITHVISNTHIRVEANYHTVSSVKFTILKTGLILNEGTHEVIAKSGNNVTVNLKSWHGWSVSFAGTKPRVLGWLGATSKILKTVLKQSNNAGSGFVGEQSGAISKVENLVLRGGTGGTGIRLRGAVTADVYSSVQSNFCLGRESAVVGFANCVAGFAGSNLHAPYAHFMGATSHGLSIGDGCSAYLRGAVLAGNSGIGMLLSGNYCRLSEARLLGNKLQGIRTDAGGFFYSDSGYAFGNVSHGLMIVNISGGQFADGFSMCNGGSGVNSQNGGSLRLSRILAACNANHGLSFTSSVVEVGHCWATGSKSTRSGIVNNGSQMSAFSGASAGNGGLGLLAIEGGLAVMTSGYLSKNKLGGVSARHLARVAMQNGYIENNNGTNILTATGAQISGVVSQSINTVQLSGAINTANVVIADDAVAIFAKSTVFSWVAGHIEIMGSSPTSVWGEVFVRVGSSNSTAKLRGHADLETNNITLTGTNSVDGKLTVSTDATNIYIANRLGSAISINVLIKGRIL